MGFAFLFYLIMSSSLPIGIFDSGIGGLTVASAINKLLPNEQLIYFGDTAHLPYGEKSPEAIKYYSLKIAKFLMDKKCKLIVIACHTASSQAYDDLIEFMGDRIPIVSMVDPVVDKIVTEKRYKKIGVIGTKSTIKANLYQTKIRALNPNIEVAPLATPLLAKMIEEGFFNHQISHAVIHSYLSSPKLKKIDSLILACTHYPLIEADIRAFYRDQVAIIDPADIVANYVRSRLKELALLSGSEPKRHQFFVSDYTSGFEKSTRIFFGQKVHLSYKNIWGNDGH